ncbi:MAG: hypothetical protein V1725_01525 [archaeon]
MAKPLPKQKEATAQEDYFVAVKDAPDIRRGVLESSRRVIYALQDYHKLVLLRQKKQLFFERFREQLKEVTLLCNKLNKYFPDEKIAAYRNQLRAKRAAEEKAKQEAVQKARQEAAKAEQQKTEQPKKQPIKPEPQPTPKPTSPTIKPKSELDQLNDLLSGIEAKLKRMG